MKRDSVRTILNIFEGNVRHISGYSPYLFGQKPKLCVLHCSDSRENLNLLADIHPSIGKIFKIENAGNVIDGSVSATGAMAYAAIHLGVKDILIFGHTGCGAIKAAFGDYEEESWPIAEHISLLKNITEITKIAISQMKKRSISAKEIFSNENYLAIASEINVDYQAHYLKKVLFNLGITDVRIHRAIHDIHGLYGGKNGRLYLVHSEKEFDSEKELFPHAKKLVDYGLEKTFEDKFPEFGVKFIKEPKEA